MDKDSTLIKTVCVGSGSDSSCIPQIYVWQNEALKKAARLLNGGEFFLRREEATASTKSTAHNGERDINHRRWYGTMISVITCRLLHCDRTSLYCLHLFNYSRCILLRYLGIKFRETVFMVGLPVLNHSHKYLRAVHEIQRPLPLSLFMPIGSNLQD